jgi:hypothetical protein
MAELYVKGRWEVFFISIFFQHPLSRNKEPHDSAQSVLGKDAPRVCIIVSPLLRTPCPDFINFLHFNNFTLLVALMRRKVERYLVHWKGETAESI